MATSDSVERRGAVRALDDDGLVFEDDPPDTLAQAIAHLEESCGGAARRGYRIGRRGKHQPLMRPLSRS